jgi:hypothetical protein
MKNPLLLTIIILGIFPFAFSKDKTPESAKSLAQTDTEQPKSNEAIPPAETKETPVDLVKDQVLNPENEPDEDEKIKREEEFNKYCEGAPDDPQCD